MLHALVAALSSSLRKTPRAVPRRSRTLLQLTRLESRENPSGPSFTSLSTEAVANDWIVWGQVADPSPSTVAVAISGSVSGNATVSSNGSFEFITPQNGSGSVSVQATDSQGLTCGANLMIVPMMNAPPYLSMKIIPDGRTSVAITGNVIATNPSGLTVNLGGKVSGTATTASDGSFSVVLTASGLGNVTGVTSSGGVSSNTVTQLLNSSAPVISNFFSMTQSGNTYTFTGTVTDPDAAGLTVTFSSAISQIDGLKATVASNGTFTLTVTLPAGTDGTVSVQTTDWWGLVSNTDSTTV